MMVVCERIDDYEDNSHCEKSCELSDENNYKTVFLTNIMSKLFEIILLSRCRTYTYTQDNQFLFKDGDSTDTCVFTSGSKIS